MTATVISIELHMNIIYVARFTGGLWLHILIFYGLFWNLGQRFRQQIDVEYSIFTAQRQSVLGNRPFFLWQKCLTFYP